MFELPKLKYSFNGLEPYLDAETVEIHYTKHHQNYLNNLNKALENLPETKGKSIDSILSMPGEIPEALRRTVINNGGGYLNHNLYWDIMSSKPKSEPGGILKQNLENEYGSIEAFKDKFNQTAAAVFGSGWAWLSLTKNNLIIETTQNQDSPVTAGNVPIIGLDVWEHAYYLKYRNKRVDYIQNWWKVLDWERVEELYRQATV